MTQTVFEACVPVEEINDDASNNAGHAGVFAKIAYEIGAIRLTAQAFDLQQL